jgi:GNAT superfamily N-acetyltransferase
MEIREPSEADLDALSAFFERVPESERTFFKEPVLDRATVEGWLTGERGRRGLALSDDGRVVGYVAVIRLTGWSDHVGEVRLVVDPEARGQGLGRALARWALLQALDCDLKKLTVEVVAEQ